MAPWPTSLASATTAAGKSMRATKPTSWPARSSCAGPTPTTRSASTPSCGPTSWSATARRASSAPEAAARGPGILRRVQDGCARHSCSGRRRLRGVHGSASRSRHVGACRLVVDGGAAAAWAGRKRQGRKRSAPKEVEPQCAQTTLASFEAIGLPRGPGRAAACTSLAWCSLLMLLLRRLTRATLTTPQRSERCVLRRCRSTYGHLPSA